MTTYFNFTPSQIAPYSFQPVIDGQPFNAQVTWSLFGRRFYLNLYDPDGALALATAVVGSPTGFALQGLSWARGLATATAAAPHGYKVGAVVDLTISGAAPDAYNGQVKAFITGPSTFTYPIAAAPGAATAFGMAAYNINLLGGRYASTLVFRQANQQFELNP